MLERPQPGDYPPFAQTYIDKVPSGSICENLDQNTKVMNNLLSEISQDAWDYRYAPGKWSVKESLNHVVDTERIFAYRALRIARGDQTPLAGFDQDMFADQCNLEDISGASILEGFNAVRKSSAILFKQIQSEDWNKTGIASDHNISVLSLGFMIVGHANHHVELFREKYSI